jgi:hypothetical protein
MKTMLLLAALLAGCDGGGQKKATDPDKGGAQPDNSGGAAQPDNRSGTQPGKVGGGNSGKAFPADTPAVQACKVDADCTVAVDAALGPDPCCNVTTTAMPIAVAYVQFMDRWQKANCAGVSCPPLSLPGAQTAPCGMRGRCEKGTCTNSCGLPPDGGPGPPPPP